MTSLVERPLTGEFSVAAAKVSALLQPAAPLGVAFSGGVDSSVLLALAVLTLGAGQAVAILGVSPSLAADERRAAHEVAAFIGARLVEVQTREGDNPAYRANGPDRCFHCKDELFSRIDDEVAGAYGVAAVAYGENADDIRRPDRPGSRAATSHQVLRPLADAGLGKAAVRAIARALQLPRADKPAAPCLASRIPHFRGQAKPDRGGREGAADAGISRVPGPPPRRGGPHRAARRGPGASRLRSCQRADPRRGHRRRLPVRRRRRARHPVRRVHDVLAAGHA